MNSYVSLDLETTGLNPKYEKIIEIGAVKVIDGEVTDTFKTFVNPARKLDENVVELTGITEEMIADAPLIENVLPSLIEFIGDYPLLGHRILFDYSFVKRNTVNMNIEFDKEGVDTLKLSRICHNELSSKKLSDMCTHYNISLDAHRAYNDAFATHKLFQALKENFESKYPEYFTPTKLIYKSKKESPIRPLQAERLKAYLKRHNIDCPYDIEQLSKNEVQRYMDKLVSQYGKD